MLALFIGWILVVSGVITAGAGLAALLFPHLFLRLGFVVGALIVYSAYAPTTRAPVLAAAAIEKFAIGLLTFFGPIKPTRAMTAIAIGDGAFAILYVAYLSGL